MKRFTLLVFAFLCAYGHIAAQSNNATETRAKYRLGLNVGSIIQCSDVKSQLGWGAGVTFEKVLLQNDRSLLGFTVRARYLYAISRGRDLQGLSNIDNNQALNGTLNPALSYTDQNFVFHNYRTKKHDLALELMIEANRLRANTGVIFYVFGGIGGVGFDALIDQLNAAGETYQYTNIDNNSPRSQIINSLNSIRDGVYESPADGNGPNDPSVTFAANLGLGLGYELSPVVSVGLEHRVNFTFTDVLDGQQWDANNLATGDNDKYHYTGLWLKFSINGSSTSRPISNNNPPNPTNPTYTPVRPSVTINHPPQSTYTTTQCNMTVVATVTNVPSKQAIIITSDGRRLNPSQFNYNASTGKVQIPTNINGSTTIRISAGSQSGSDAQEVRLICEERPSTNTTPKPSIQITNPGQSPFTTNNCYSIAVDAIVQNVNSINDITITQNGREISGNYNRSNKKLQIKASIDGNTTFIIKARNNAGTASATQVVKCNSFTPSKPTVNITKPRQDPYVSANCRADITAMVTGVSGKERIKVLKNGSNFPRSNYQYNTSSQVLTLSDNFDRSATYTITATNNAGSATESVTIKCNTTPTTPRPTVNITKPATSPFVSSDCMANILATVTGVQTKERIKVTANGQPVGRQFYTYNASRKQLDFSMRINKETEFRITATNNAGSASDITTIKCQPTTSTKKPIVNITSPAQDPYEADNCRTQIIATVRNVSNVRYITVKKGSSIMTASQYTFNNTTKKLTIPVEISGQTRYTITAKNNAGSASDAITIKCKPKPVTPKPLVTITSPTSNPYNAPGCKTTITATLKNITGVKQVTVKAGTRTLPSSEYVVNITRGIVTIPVKIRQQTRYVITGTNSAGSATAAITIKCSAPAVKPTVKITTPIRSPFLSANCKSNIVAKVTGVKGKSNITVRRNNVVIPASAYSYNTANKELRINGLELSSGNNVFQIMAMNDAGSATASTTLTCKPRAATPKPVITITDPKSSPFTTTNCKYTIKATVKHIQSVQNISVKKDGRIVVPSSYSYNTGSKVLTIRTTIDKQANYQIIAKNSAGTAIVSQIIKCSQTASIAKPVVVLIRPRGNPAMVSGCKATIEASIQNVSNISQITVMKGTQKLPAKAYTYNAQTKKVLIKDQPVTPNQNTKFTIKATNRAGTDSKYVNVSCKPTGPVATVDIIKPVLNPFVAQNCSTNLTVRINHVTNANQISVTRNGATVDPNTYMYNPNAKMLLVQNVYSTPGDSTTYVITASNSNGTGSDSIVILCGSSAQPRSGNKPQKGSSTEPRTPGRKSGGGN